MRRKHSRHIHKAAASKNSARFSTPLPQYCLIAAVLLGGIIWGSVIANRSSVIGKDSFVSLLQEMLSKEAASKGFVSLFFSSFFSTSLLLCAAYILGLCALGSPGHLAVAAFKGAGIGLSMGYIYIQYGVKGFAICALFILPWALITSLAVLIACREGIRFSFRMARVLLPSGGQGALWGALCEYSYRFLFCFVLALFAALIESLSTLAFGLLFFS